jgi:hypothetical protein
MRSSFPRVSPAETIFVLRTTGMPSTSGSSFPHPLGHPRATALRGRAFKPPTSPYRFQGLKEKGLQLLAEARSAR